MYKGLNFTSDELLCNDKNRYDRDVSDNFD
jgi:hypothetical protein